MKMEPLEIYNMFGVAFAPALELKELNKKHSNVLAMEELEPFSSCGQ